MRKLIEASRYLSLIAVVSLLLASLLGFVLGAIKTGKAFAATLKSGGQDPLIVVQLIQIADAFLIATALFVFAVSLYELFIEKLDLPDWMLAHNLPQLKAKLSSVLILVMGATFVEHLVEWKNAQDTLLFGLAIAVVSGALILLGGAAKSND